MVVAGLELILGLFAAPLLVGGLFGKAERQENSRVFQWISGQILLWALFLILSVPMILLELSFSYVYYSFLICMTVLTLVALVRCRHGKGTQKLRVVPEKEEGKRSSNILWIIAGLLLLLQLVLTVMLAYEEGDDAFYVAVTTITVDADTMYQKLPYTGGATGLDARHGLAPFPVWESVWARLTGIHPAAIAQIILPLTLILMAYGVYYLFAKKLKGKHGWNVPLFMILVEVLILFGGYSVYSPENFLLVRTSQGKAVLAAIVIPFLFLLLLQLFEQLEQGKQNGRTWFLIGSTMLVACLCSTQGALITCILLGLGTLCAAVCYRRWKLLLPMMACCVIPVGMSLLYFVLR